MRRNSRALTLVEVMITLVIFIFLAGFAMMAVSEVVTQWTTGERRRVLFDRAAGVIDTMADDLRLAVTREPTGIDDIKARFIGDYEPGTKQQRLMFVRSFEAGPERSLTANAGSDAIDPTIAPPDDPNIKLLGGKPPPATTVSAGHEDYTGLKAGRFKALGGMAMVAYFVKNNTLYRAIRAPVSGKMTDLLDPNKAQVLSPDVLYLSFDYWTQKTSTWTEQKIGSKAIGPEKIWDSTRGISAFPLNQFVLHREGSEQDPEDDVFPEKVRITVTVDSSMPRCIFTRITNEIGETDLGLLEVESTKGFNDGDEENSLLLIDQEWLHYKKKTPEGFIIDKRAVRGTHAKTHTAKSIVRTGRTFHRTIYIPNWREDETSDEFYRTRKQLRNAGRAQ